MTPSIDTVEMLQAILSSIDEGIHVVNAEGETIYYNAAVARLDGLDPKEVIGKLILDVFPSLDRDTSTLIRALQTGKPIKDQRQSYTNVKGKRVETVNTTLPIRVNGRIVGAVEVAKDISKIKSLSEQVIELQTKMHLSGKRKGASKVEKGGNLGNRTHMLYRAEDFLTQDERMLDMKRSLPRIAQTDSPILVYGETGTGKEIVIQAIHAASPRARHPFIAQNCAALPSTLLESLLFGTTKGSFTGSADKPGLFELADGGTLFLDEINSMPIELQAKLLRVLQEGTVRRIGGRRTIPVDVRVLVAMNESPQQALQGERIRADLYYRIQVVSLFILPLRERPDDMPLYIDHFLNKYNLKFSRQVEKIDADVMRFLTNYTWPGNVRELEHAIEGAMNLVSGPVLRKEHLPPHLLQIWPDMIPAQTAQREELKGAPGQLRIRPLKQRLEDEERYWIQYALQNSAGNIKQAAQLLAIPRQTLQYKLKKYDLLSRAASKQDAETKERGKVVE